VEFHPDVTAETGQQWGYYSTSADLDSLLRYLNFKGKRESELINNLSANYQQILAEMHRRVAEQEAQQFQARRSDRIKGTPNGDNHDAQRSYIAYVNKATNLSGCLLCLHVFHSSFNYTHLKCIMN